MNSNDPLPKPTADLLRAPLPDTGPRPGLETRLLAGIRDAPAPSRFPVRFVLGTLCTVLLVAALLVRVLSPSSPPAITTATNPGSDRPVLEITALPNPLGKEATALRSTATRAGRFLINCLPSLPDSGDQW